MQIKPIDNLSQVEKRISKKNPKNRDSTKEEDSFSNILDEIDIVELSNNTEERKQGTGQNQNKNQETEEDSKKEKPTHINRFA